MRLLFLENGFLGSCGVSHFIQGVYLCACVFLLVLSKAVSQKRTQSDISSASPVFVTTEAGRAFIKCHFQLYAKVMLVLILNKSVSGFLS